MFWLVSSLILCVEILPAASFYLPGIAPINYKKGEKLEVKVKFAQIPAFCIWIYGLLISLNINVIEYTYDN